jgi:hypothetical protein
LAFGSLSFTSPALSLTSSQASRESSWQHKTKIHALYAKAKALSESIFGVLFGHFY